MKIGIEQEFVFKDKSGCYQDPENSTYGLFNSIVDDFPLFPDDDAFFECKSLEKQPKRCYVEGLERYDLNGQLAETLTKGLEIRTLPHATVEGVIEGLCRRNYSRADTRQLVELHNRRGVWVLEFRAFDACGDARLLEALLNIFRGFLLDKTLMERLPTQNPERLKRSSAFPSINLSSR